MIAPGPLTVTLLAVTVRAVATLALNRVTEMVVVVIALKLITVG